MIKVTKCGSVEVTYDLALASLEDLETLRFATINYSHVISKTDRWVSHSAWVQLIRKSYGATPQTHEVCDVLSKLAVNRSFEITLLVNDQGERRRYQVPEVVAETFKQAFAKIKNLDDRYPIIRVISVKAKPWTEAYKARLQLSDYQEGSNNVQD